MALYNVGDIVMVCDDLEDGDTYDGVNVTYEMEQLAGCAVTISRVTPEGYYFVQEDEDEYIWTESMFSGLAEQTMYKPGDVVVVRNDISFDKRYCMLSGPRSGLSAGIGTQMKKYAGKTVTIASICNGVYRIKEDDGAWNWTDEMLSDYAQEIETATDEEMFALLGCVSSGGGD